MEPDPSQEWRSIIIIINPERTQIFKEDYKAIRQVFFNQIKSTPNMQV